MVRRYCTVYLGKVMYKMTASQIDVVVGGQDCSKETTSSTKCPVPNPQSEVGKLVDDVAGVAHDLGTWLGGKIYDATH